MIRNPKIGDLVNVKGRKATYEIDELSWDPDVVYVRSTYHKTILLEVQKSDLNRLTKKVKKHK